VRNKKQMIMIYSNIIYGKKINSYLKSPGHLGKVANHKIKEFDKIEKMNDEQSEDGSTFLNNFMKAIIVEIIEDDLDNECIIYDENLL
jgi:hypothetical protein